MCGLNGFFSLQPILATEEIILNMNASLQHRGPDAGDYWHDQVAGLVLGHRRLAIQDVSPAGAQPMHSTCGRYVLVFNGEIYNHLKLRDKLARHGHAVAWQGHSDTETLLACFATWGIEHTLQATVGMFAIALWDRKNSELTLARDRMGEKPLYYGWQRETFLFGSELKALKAHPAFTAEVDRNALTLLLRHNYIPAPHSIYQGVSKLLPGHFLTLPLGIPEQAKLAQPQAYWSFNQAVEQGKANAFAGTEQEAVNALRQQLSGSIGEQMLSDVPLGAFLSGGIDSSTIVALMQEQSRQPVRTFTMGFAEGGYNEAEHAKQVARHLGTEHTELYVSPDDALSVIPKLPAMYCEPFADSSQIPTFMVSQLARQHVTVALSGDGGDELFGGYNRYLMARRVWGRMQKLPNPARKAAAHGLRALSPNAWDKLFSLAGPVLPGKLRLRTPGDKAHKLAGVLDLNNGEQFFHRLTSHWQDPASVVLGASEPATLLTTPEAWPETDSFEHWMMAMDAQTYMADDILVKVDRAAMATSLETRVPMLDHRVVELAWQMPLHYKIRNGEGKWLLRQVLYRHVPEELIERPKMGFAIPLDDWLRGPLREWAEALLNEQRLAEEGFFNVSAIRQIWHEHISGKYNHATRLWPVLMFQAWLENETN
ncbi:asparagine synthase (glutamine-hydrolyzing) [Zobellella maritima]|uniref:asparagine synthase (glutamine-hydrolyzing) n=1 Tax=Zobellella maritima TaxID=2059725 RepID=UPI000E30892F|nr:asparagine synthase (glutamine-hydrolyzing) [Zobellella maritima]